MSALAVPDLAQAIEREHQAAIGSARSAIEHAVACGRLLIQAKDTVPHGGWLDWIDHNVTIGRRQAQKYMRLAEHPDALSNAKSNALLTIDSAISTIARPQASPTRKPSNPEPAKPVPAPAPRGITPGTAQWEAAQDAWDQIAARARPRPRDPTPTAVVFHGPPPGRPRLDLGPLERIKTMYEGLAGVDRNAFARWVLEHQLRQTDLSPKQKSDLAKILEVLTDYSDVAP
jgi:Protein of unknown function (DUF3102)